MLVTLAGPVTYMIVYFISTRLLTILLSLGNKYYYSLSTVNMIGIVLAFVSWIYVFKKGFETGWMRALGIAIVAVIVFVIMGIAMFGYKMMYASNKYYRLILGYQHIFV